MKYTFLPWGRGASQQWRVKLDRIWCQRMGYCCDKTDRVVLGNTVGAIYPGKAVEGLEWGQSRFLRRPLHMTEATVVGWLPGARGGVMGSWPVHSCACWPEQSWRYRTTQASSLGPEACETQMSDSDCNLSQFFSSGIRYSIALKLPKSLKDSTIFFLKKFKVSL